MNTLIPIVAAISGDALITALVWIVIVGLICGLLWWFLEFIKLREPFNQVARVIVALVAVIFLINALLTLVGKPFINW